MLTATVGELLRIHFPVFQEDGITPDTGLLDAAFAKTLLVDTIVSGQPVTVIEVAATGRYFATFTPNVTGRWYLDVTTPAEDVFAALVNVLPAGAGSRVVASMAFNPMTITLDGNVWLERDGILDTVVTSATVSFYNSAGALLFPALIDLAPDAQGFFRIMQPAPAGFTQGAEIYMVMSIVTPTGTITTGKGIQVVG